MLKIIHNFFLLLSSSHNLYFGKSNNIFLFTMAFAWKVSHGQCDGHPLRTWTDISVKVWFCVQFSWWSSTVFSYLGSLQLSKQYATVSVFVSVFRVIEWIHIIYHTSKHESCHPFCLSEVETCFLLAVLAVIADTSLSNMDVYFFNLYAVYPLVFLSCFTPPW